MDRFLFADGDICLYEEGKVTKYPSKFIEKYKANALDIERAKSWKQSGTGAQFRGDIDYGRSETSFESAINGIYVLDSAEIAYSFTVNRTSGIYKKRLDDEKAEEVHVINSLDANFGAGCMDSSGGTLAISVSNGAYNSDIAVFDLNSGEYKTVTDGDTLDDDPFISPEDGNIIYFSSRGAGRNARGEFVAYSPAAICELDLRSVEVREIISSPKYNYYKPVAYGGKLYALRTPLKEKGANPLIEIALIPFRIVQAIANFINVFVTAFTGKSLASGGSNPTKARDTDSRKEFVKGNLIDVEKQIKKNAKRGGDYGYIPLDWQIIEVESGKVIKSGVADYDILSDGTLIAADGKHIYAIKDGKCVKLCDTGKCVKVSAEHKSACGNSLFGL